MADPIYLRTIETVLNKPNITTPPVQQWSTQYDPSRINDPTYMGGLIPQEIRRAGVYEQVRQRPYRPRPPRKGRVHYPGEQSLAMIHKIPDNLPGLDRTPNLKPNRKPIFETLFED